MDNYDILSPVNSKNVFGRIIWIFASFISIVLLLISFFFENAILVILDGLLPLAFFIYRFIKKKEYPFYYYLICSCGLYLLYWEFFLSPDYVFGAINDSLRSFFEKILVTLIVTIPFILIFKYLKKYTSHLKNNDKLDKFYLSVETIIFVAFILGTQFSTLNVVLDTPYTEQYVYITDIKHYRNTSTVYYKYSLNDDSEYSIDSHFYFEEKIVDAVSGEPMAKIEYGKGAFGFEWKKIIE